MSVAPTPKHKLFVANRGEIAVRIIRTAQRLGLHTIAVYTASDAVSPHVALADEAVEIADASGGESARPHLSVETQVAAAQARGATLVHPGYGFLSESADFARAVRDAGMAFVGPSAEVIRRMGLKHEARAVARRAGVPVVPGSENYDGLVEDAEQAVVEAERIGWPVMVKATAGGGGMGLVVCNDERELRHKFGPTKERAKALFHHDGLFLERFFPSARHIEVQVFGDGHGKVIHFGERECSLQRRHQKVVEETPSPFLEDRPALRQEMCMAAVRLCEEINYASAGTVEFIVDDPSGQFFFLEMNTRIQVEHPITEATHPGLDLVELMLLQALGDDTSLYAPTSSFPFKSSQIPQASEIHAIEVRVYAENPAEGFRPCPGILQCVDFDLRVEGVEKCDWLRVDTWVNTGTVVTPHFDPLLAKLIVTAPTRALALSRLSLALSNITVAGPPNNIEYLRSVCAATTVRLGQATTRWLEDFPWTPKALTVLQPGLSMMVQDMPGRPALHRGIPPSGALDPRAHSAANILAGNPPGTEALEVIVVRDVECRIKFHVSTVIGIAGGKRSLRVRVTTDQDGSEAAFPLWRRLIVPAGSVVEVADDEEYSTDAGGGFRVYIAVKGGFPGIASFLGSKSTSMGLGGYQGRDLASGDQIALQDSVDSPDVSELALSSSFVPSYSTQWTLRVLSGPHDDSEFLTPEGIDKFYRTTWVVSAASNRMGIRLAPYKLHADESRAILWARENGGDGGSHPSNILDNAYARGSINVNGDTPVILGPEGPDMGGYVCLCVIVEGDMWKLGQLSPGCTLQFERVSWSEARRLKAEEAQWTADVETATSGTFTEGTTVERMQTPSSARDPKLHVTAASSNSVRPQVVYRQAGDSAILVEYGPMQLDFNIRARVHAFELAAHARRIPGVVAFGPCIRSTMVCIPNLCPVIVFIGHQCYYDPTQISQADLLHHLVEVERTLPVSLEGMTFPGRRITFPIILDDSWNREALQRYMRTTRDKAVYLPSNIEYLAKNNGLHTGEEALSKLIGSDFLVFGVGFYLGCPFLVPIDPRCRLVGQKMNPSRTYTPRGAIGIAGLVAAIYPIESPGGYQLYGRTLPSWNTWGKGAEFSPDKPWLLEPFDQVHFELADEKEYLELEKAFDAGRYPFKIEHVVFSMEGYNKFCESIADEVTEYRIRQAAGVAREEARENELLREWEREKQATGGGELGGEAKADQVGGTRVFAPLSSSVWKIQCTIGDIIHSAEDVLVILEAMKTEISVKAGKQSVGHKVRGFGRGIKEGATVSSGDILVVLE
ncbi:urea carboxylase [Auriscalpium vulgare]|uniref:Urea carboxylase n=1 Tax=Auriscalpium vulgare TaxID=40419 RepID=A0ACB8RPX2_9AGAM|nr:urea carboxylase [Auriscalpium vulgare]